MVFTIQEETVLLELGDRDKIRVTQGEDCLRLWFVRYPDALCSQPITLTNYPGPLICTLGETLGFHSFRAAFEFKVGVLSGRALYNPELERAYIFSITSLQPNFLVRLTKEEITSLKDMLKSLPKEEGWSAREWHKSRN